MRSSKRATCLLRKPLGEKTDRFGGEALLELRDSYLTTVVGGTHGADDDGQSHPSDDDPEL